MIIPEAYHHMHPMGDSTYVAVDPAVNDVSGLVYIHIPKNASCWTKYHLDSLKSVGYNYYHQGFDARKNLALVILRDPMERWVSAMGQILVGNRPDYYLYIDNLDWNQITSKIIRNNHTQPQHEFFANIPHDRIVWFRCDDSLKDHFNSFLKEYNFNVKFLSEENDVYNLFNVTKKVAEQVINDFKTPRQQEIIDKILSKLDQHPEYRERIKNLYQQDYEFLNSVPYYEPR
jgi:hypothetical protein